MQQEWKKTKKLKFNAGHRSGSLASPMLAAQQIWSTLLFRVMAYRRPKYLVVPRVERSRKKEPPAVGIGGGKLPSCTLVLPSLSSRCRLFLRPRHRAQRSPCYPSIPLHTAWSSLLFRHRHRCPQACFTRFQHPGQETDMVPNEILHTIEIGIFNTYIKLLEMYK